MGPRAGARDFAAKLATTALETWKAEVDVYSPDVILATAAEVDGEWPITHGQFTGVWVLHDPTGLFPHLEALAISQPQSSFEHAMTEVIVGDIYELIGKLRKPPMLEVPELKRRLDAGEDVLVLDVRPLDGFTGELGHIPGVTHIPLDELEGRVHELDEYQDKSVVTICRTDRMSSQAAQLLAQKGFAKVVVAKMSA